MGSSEMGEPVVVSFQAAQGFQPMAAAPVFSGPPGVPPPRLQAQPATDRFERRQPAPLHFEGARRRIMTYNVRNLNNGRMNDEASLKALAQVIRRENPDVIALQEVESWDALYRFNELYLDGAYSHIVFPEQQKDSNHRLGFLAKAPVRVVSSQSHLAEQNQGKFHGKRDFLEATFETDTGYRFTLFNAHFKATHQYPTKSEKHNALKLARFEAIREEEARNAAAILRSFLAQRPEERVLVLGDFNTERGNPHGDRVFRTVSLQDDDNPANDLAGVLKAIHARRGEPEPDVRTVRSGRFDTMLASASLMQDMRTAYVAGDLFVEPWVSASDHLPVVAELEEPDEPALEQAVREPLRLPRRPALNRIA